MANTIEVQLSALRFFCGHGLHAEEALIEAAFEVDLRLRYKAPKAVIDSLNDSIDYVRAYQLVKEVMATNCQLLETCAQLIAQRIETEFPTLKQLKITIRKIDPPITNFTGSVGVCLRKTY